MKLIITNVNSETFNYKGNYFNFVTSKKFVHETKNKNYKCMFKEKLRLFYEQ